MKDILLSGLDLDLDLFKPLIKKLDPQKVLYRRSDPSLRICGIADDADIKELSAFALEHQVDCIRMPQDLSIKAFKVFATDLDSTLLHNECVDDMAFDAGCIFEVMEITKEAAKEEWPFIDSLVKRVALLKNAPKTVIDHAVKAERFTDGAETLLQLCRRNGLSTYIISGGFKQIAARHAKKLSMTGVVCNELVVKDGRLTGEVAGPAGGKLLDAAGKRRSLEVLASINGALMTQTIAIGDGMNDIDMVLAAGLGVAFHPKPTLARENPKAVIRFGGLDVLAHMFKETWVDAVCIRTKA